MKYDVHCYPIFRVKLKDLQGTPEEMVTAAEFAVGQALNDQCSKATQTMGVPGQDPLDLYFADGFDSALVDETDDKGRRLSSMKKEANLLIELDVNDCFDSVGDMVYGVEQGLGLASQVLAVREIKGNETARIYRLTYTVYSNDDSIAFFVGTESGLTNLFVSNQVQKSADSILSDSDREDLPDNNDEI